MQPLLAGSLLGLGKCYLDNGMNKQAIDYLERAARIRPKLAEPYYLLGKAYENTDKRKSIKLLKHFRKIVAKDPEFLSRLPEVNRRISELSKGAAQGKRIKK